MFPISGAIACASVLKGPSSTDQKSYVVIGLTKVVYEYLTYAAVSSQHRVKQVTAGQTHTRY